MAKKLIVCADGTWNREDEIDEGLPCPTNVTKVARSLLPSDADGVSQVVHYERGVGTSLGIRMRGGALGRGIFKNVTDCLDFWFITTNRAISYIFFGFSRGAYTVRSLAGLVRNSGILRRGQESFEDEAIDLYRDYNPETAPDSARSKKFRADHSHDSPIEFIGVWDTVGALGIPGMDGRFRILKGLDWQFHDVTLSSRVKSAFHALAIHEHRTDFTPTLWEQQPSAKAGGQQLEQMWFSGVHSDVGGGYPQTGLSDVALEWMVQKAEDYGGLEFDRTALALKPEFAAKGHDSFGTFYRVLDWLRRKKGGTLREYRQDPAAETCEDIHDSVMCRVRALDEKWPDSFEREIQRRLGR